MRNPEFPLNPWVFENAADRVEEEWAQGAYYRRGAVCAVGAIRMALGAIVDYTGEVEPRLLGKSDLDAPCVYYVDYLRDYHVRDWSSIAAWNDHYEQTAENVAETLRQAARELRRNPDAMEWNIP